MENAPGLIDEIQNIPWFSELSAVQIERMAAIASICQTRVGEEIFREGDRVDNLYVILSGEMVLENYIPSLGKHDVAKAEPLDVIGWSCLTPVVRQRTATARASQPSRLLCFNGEALIRLCEEDRDLGYRIMRRVSNIVATMYLSTRLHLYDIIRNSSHSLAQSNMF